MQSGVFCIGSLNVQSFIVAYRALILHKFHWMGCIQTRNKNIIFWVNKMTWNCPSLSLHCKVAKITCSKHPFKNNLLCELLNVIP